YSLGVTLYELLTHRNAFDASDRLQLVRQIAEQEPVRPRLIEPRIPRDLETIILKAMDKEPKRRYRSAGALAADLSNFLNDEPIWARRVSAPERLFRWARRNRNLAVLLFGFAMILTVLAVGGALAAKHYRQMLDNQRQLTLLGQQLAQEKQSLVDQEASKNLEVTAEKEDVQRQLYYAQLRLAHEAWRTHRGVTRMRGMLNAWQPKAEAQDFRGWEWYYLRGLIDSELRLIRVPGETVISLRSNPRTGELAAVCSSGYCRMWSPKTGRASLTITPPSHDARSLAWSPDGQKLAIGCESDTVRVYAAHGDLERELLASGIGGIHAVDWSPDGKRLAVVGQDASVRLLDVGDGQELGRWHQHHGPLYAVAWSPDGQWVATAGDDASVLVWNAEDGSVAQTFTGHAQSIRSVSWSPDSSQLASGSWDHTIRIWNALTGEAVRQFRGHTHFVSCVDWSPDGEQLASVGYDQVLRVWSVRSAEPIRVLRGHTDLIRAVAWCRDGQHVTSAGNDSTLRVWSTVDALESTTYEGHSGQYWSASVAWSPDGDRIASAAADHHVRVWNATSRAELALFTQHEDEVAKLRWSPDGREVISASKDGTVRVWDATTGEQRLILARHSAGVSAVDWSLDGKYIATGGYDGTLAVWNARSGEFLEELKPHDGRVRDVRWSSDSRQLATVGDDRQLQLHRLLSALDPRHCTMPAEALCVDWDPTGKFLAVGCGDFKIDIVSEESLQSVGQMLGHSDWVFAVAWSPDGSRLASGGVDRSVRVWDPFARCETLVLDGHTKSVNGLAWSPNGMRLASASEDATVRVWNALRGYREERSEQLLPMLVASDAAEDVELRIQIYERIGQTVKAKADRLRLIERYENEWRGSHLEETAHRLADLFLSDDHRWRPLTLAKEQHRSSGGALIVSEPDHSLYVSGTNPDEDAYALRMRTTPGTIAGIRLETIPDQRLPEGGAGRAPQNGNFILSEFRARHVNLRGGGTEQLSFGDVFADCSFEGNPISHVTDEERETAWNTWPTQLEPHVVVFEVDDPVTIAADEDVLVELEFQGDGWPHHSLGHFRLSTTELPNAVFREQLRRYLQVSEEQGYLRLAGAYYCLGRNDLAREALTAKPTAMMGVAAVLDIVLDPSDAGPDVREHAVRWLDDQASTSGSSVPWRLPRP
ncbi:MAG: hypothetical protein KDA60_04235, partial [Planctomycetales bacterium]|nr:hypothetical protein [Planctomycetales bacterium]